MHDYERRVNLARKDEMPKSEKISDKASESIGVEGLGEITPEAQQYILNLHSRLSFVKKKKKKKKKKEKEERKKEKGAT
ncbi:unnamed protein product [Camellia sinensis]